MVSRLEAEACHAMPSPRAQKGSNSSMIHGPRFNSLVWYWREFGRCVQKLVRRRLGQRLGIRRISH